MWFGYKNDFIFNRWFHVCRSSWRTIFEFWLISLFKNVKNANKLIIIFFFLFVDRKNDFNSMRTKLNTFILFPNRNLFDTLFIFDFTIVQNIWIRSKIIITFPRFFFSHQRKKIFVKKRNTVSLDQLIKWISFHFFLFILNPFSIIIDFHLWRWKFEANMVSKVILVPSVQVVGSSTREAARW